MGVGFGLLHGLLVTLLQNAFGALVYRAANPAHFEVERKFHLKQHEVSTVTDRLREQGFSPAGVVIMTDTFIPPPAKGEMLRVRDERVMGQWKTVFTRKSWVTTSDGGKERRECERSVSPFLRAVVLLVARLICGDLASFTKERKLFEGNAGEFNVVISVDQVSGLGQYSGNYLEVEVIVPLDEDTSKARDTIFAVAARLFGSERDDVRQSYQEMLRLYLQGK
jgi:predicted adenylyl cyclase CyaB